MDNKGANSPYFEYTSSYQPIAQPSSPGKAPPPTIDGRHTPLSTTPAGTASTRKPLRRLGPTAIVTIVVGTLVELGVVSFLVYFWTGIGSNPDGERASSFWRYLVLRNYATRTVTICALVLRTAVDLQAVVCTGLAAALLIETRAIYMSDMATVSILRAVNGGPWTLAREFSWRPAVFFRTAPAFLTLALLLDVIAIQFTSTLLLADFRSATIVSDGMNAHVPILETYPELLSPFQQRFGSDAAVWRQAVASYPTFAEQTAQPPISALGLSDTGTIKRALLPLSPKDRQTIRRYEGGAVTYVARAACVRPNLAASITGLDQVPVREGFDPILESTRLVGTVSWSPVGNDAQLEGLSPGRPLPISCAVPYSTPTVTFTSILAQGPAIVCLINPPGDDPLYTRARIFLVLTSPNTGRDWIRTTNVTRNSTRALTLPAPTESREWANYQFGTNVTLSASLCLSNATLDIENIVANSLVDPGESILTYEASNKTWNTDSITRMTDMSGSLPPLDRGILTLAQTSKISDTELDTMYRAAGENYHPQDGGAMEMAAQFLTFIWTAVYSPISLDARTTNASAGNSSIYMCSQCSPINGTYFDPHPYTVLLFHAVLDRTKSAAHALHSTLFWLTQAQYYNALPGFDFGSASDLTFSQEVSIPRVFSGLSVVIALLVLDMTLVASMVLLFLKRTQYSVYGNAWHAVAQLIAPETRHLLDRATMATDAEVARTLDGAGMSRARAGVGRAENGRIAVMRHGGTVKYGQYEEIG